MDPNQSRIPQFRLVELAPDDTIIKTSFHRFIFGKLIAAFTLFQQTNNEDIDISCHF
jgi:hypothetical protein